MNFDNKNKAIYLQIYDNICNAILRNEFGSDQRIPSVREYAASLEVNANTVMRTYEKLTNNGIIYNKRGIGFFVAPQAKIKIMIEKTEELFEKELPPIFNIMGLLGISPEQLAQEYQNFLNTKNHESQ